MITSWQPARLTRSQLEERRLEGGRLLRERRLSQAEIARRLGVTPGAVCQWAKAIRGHRGLTALSARSRPGRPSKLTRQQKAQLGRVLRRGALASGFETERWTLKRITLVVRRQFGVAYHPSSLSKVLHEMGFSPQCPTTRPRERDDALIEAWLQRDWPRIKRGLLVEAQPSSSSMKWEHRSR